MLCCHLGILGLLPLASHLPVSSHCGLREHSIIAKTKAERPLRPKVQNLQNITSTAFYMSKQDSRVGKKLGGRLYKIFGHAFESATHAGVIILLNTFFCFFIKSQSKPFQLSGMDSRTRWPLWHNLRLRFPEWPKCIRSWPNKILSQWSIFLFTKCILHVHSPLIFNFLGSQY